jgi:hypothetical protein
MLRKTWAGIFDDETLKKMRLSVLQKTKIDIAKNFSSDEISKLKQFYSERKISLSFLNESDDISKTTKPLEEPKIKKKIKAKLEGFTPEEIQKIKDKRL